MNRTHTIMTMLAASTLLLGCPSEPKQPANNEEDMSSSQTADMNAPDSGDMRAEDPRDMRPPEDAAMDADMPPDIMPSGRALSRVTTPWTPTNNMVEDPDFALSTESWIAFDGANAIQRVRRAFTTSAPQERTTIGLMPMSAKPSCIIGRVKWTRSSSHDASIWVRGGEVAVLALAVDLERSTPSLLAYDIEATEETHSVDGQTWVRYRGEVPASFGWGYLQICHTSSETVWLGAPSVTATQPTPGALRDLPSPLRAASERELERHDILTRRYSENAANVK